MKDQLYLYPHLRLIIASATIDHETFINFFGGHDKVPLILSKGIQHPIRKHWWGDPKDPWWKPINKGQRPVRQQLPRAIRELVQNLCLWLDGLVGREREEEDGHILVFLPGSQEINQTVSLINTLHLPNVIALPLYSQRPLDEQEAALNPDRDKHPEVYGKRRVVVSTNVAETSLTVEGIKHVIETGYIKESSWNPLRQVLDLQTVRHSKAGCRQRWGRAGRTSPGHAYLIYTEQEFLDFPDDSTPEIARASLEQVLLTAKAAGVRTKAGSLDLDFDWIPLKEEKDRKRFLEELSRAHSSLIQQGAIDQDGDLKREGLEMRGMPADLHVARICMEAERHGMGIEAATLLPFLRLDRGLSSLFSWDPLWDSYQKLYIRERQLDLVWGCSDDIDLYVKLWLLWDGKAGEDRDGWATTIGLNIPSFEKNICEERRKLLESVKDWRKAEDRPPSLARLDALRALIAYCLPNEIYVPVEARGGELSERPRTRFASPDLLQWQAFWEEGGQYKEYDDDLSYEESYAVPIGGRSGIYTRLNPLSQEQTEADQVEIVPTSVCFGRDELGMFVACQRRANFNHPVRTKVVAMNNVRIDPQWIPAIQGSLADRCFLYAQISRLRDFSQQVSINTRLLVPGILPTGSMVTAVVKDLPDAGGLPVNIPLESSQFSRSLHRVAPRAVMGRVANEGLQAGLHAGDQLPAQVRGYEVSANGELCVLLAPRPSVGAAFSVFRRRFRAGALIEVELVRVLEDPLGRSPMFLVRENTTCLDIPVADTDFCGNTVPRAFYGRRFAVGEHFQIRVEEIDTDLQRVRLSRGQQLLKEYIEILAGANDRITKVEIKRTDSLGVYLGLPGSERNLYVGFVRYSLWPAELAREQGLVYEARVRRSERQFTLEELAKLSIASDPLPTELDLGIDFDLLLPLAYGRFAADKNVGHFLRDVIVDKPLDDGGLLVCLNPELKSKIFPWELGLDRDGKLRSARSYKTGEELKAIIIQMNGTKKFVRLSLSHIAPPPTSLVGSLTNVVVLHSRPYYKEEKENLELRCSLDRRYILKVKAPRSDEALLKSQSAIRVRVGETDATNLIEAEYIGLV